MPGGRGDELENDPVGRFNPSKRHSEEAHKRDNMGLLRGRGTHVGKEGWPEKMG